LPASGKGKGEKNGDAKEKRKAVRRGVLTLNINERQGGKKVLFLEKKKVRKKKKKDIDLRGDLVLLFFLREEKNTKKGKHRCAPTLPSKISAGKGEQEKTPLLLAHGGVSRKKNSPLPKREKRRELGKGEPRRLARASGAGKNSRLYDFVEGERKMK